jgi:hypothetical protein
LKKSVRKVEQRCMLVGRASSGRVRQAPVRTAEADLLAGRLTTG